MHFYKTIVKMTVNYYFSVIYRFFNHGFSPNLRRCSHMITLMPVKGEEQNFPPRVGGIEGGG
jgi:hypothetical protein